MDEKTYKDMVTNIMEEVEKEQDEIIEKYNQKFFKETPTKEEMEDCSDLDTNEV